MDSMHSGDNIDSRDQRYRTSGRFVRVLYALLVFVVIAYALYFFGRPFLILEGAGQVVAPERDITAPFIADVRLAHVRAGQLVYPGALLVTLDRAGRGEALRTVSDALADRARTINTAREDLTVAEQMQERLRQRKDELQAALERFDDNAQAVDLLTRAGLQRELSDALFQWEENQAKRNQLPGLLAELIEDRSQLLRRRAEILATWENRQILAKERGTVGSGIISEGDTVTPGETMLRILDQEQKFILWELPRDVLRLPSIGEGVKIISANETTTGVVDRILPLSGASTTEPSAGSRLIEVAITDPTADLPLEGSVTVRMFYF